MKVNFLCTSQRFYSAVIRTHIQKDDSDEDEDNQ